jgi:RND family efflux transporter MFP subunit
MRKYLTRRNIIIAVVLVLMVGWWYNSNQSKSKSKNGGKIVEVVRGDVVEELTVSGEIKADKSASLNFPSSGKVSFIGVKEGEEVKRGQILTSLDLGDLQAAETKAYYAYLAADANAKYVEDQVKDHDKDESFLQKNTRVTAQTARDAAYDTWLSAQRAVRNAKLVAPFAGVVTASTITAVGDTVTVADGLIVVDPTSLYFGGEVDETDVGKIEMGQKVKVDLDAYSGQQFEGTVEKMGFLAKTSSTGATVFDLWVKMDAKVLPKLKLGMNGDAQIVLATVKNVLTLPAEAVVDGMVTIAGKEGAKVKVEVGIMGDQNAEIKAGLNEGDRVVIK